MTDVFVTAPGPIAVQRPSLSWGSIIGGWLVALGMAWLFYLLGLAVGFTAFDVADTTAVAKGIGIGTVVWVVLTWVVSLFLGGMFASWMDARPDTTVGTLHGVAVWALSITVTVLLGALGFTNLLQGGASLLKGAATAGGAAVAAGAGASQGETPTSRAAGILGAELDRAVLQAGQGRGGASPPASATAPSPAGAGAAPAATGAPPTAARSLDATTSSAVALDLLRDRPDDAKARLVAVTGLSPADADAVIQTLAPRIEKYRNDLRAAADKAQHYANAGLWALFLSTLLALIAAAFGGWAGAGHIHRVHSESRLAYSREAS